MSGEVLVDKSNSVLTLTLSNPSKRNSIDAGMYDALEAALLDAQKDDSLRALILQGAGESFAGGTDIKHLDAIRTGQDGADYEAHMARVLSRLLDLRIPVISVVRGPCVGGGLALAALSDLVYCTPGARFGSPIARTLGNTLSAPTIARLQQCFGPRATSEMLLTARLFNADEAEQRGFVTSVIPANELDAHVQGVLDEIHRCAPITIWSIKEFERRIAEQVAAVQMDDVYTAVYGSNDFREGVDAFLNKRTPQFRGT